MKTNVGQAIGQQALLCGFEPDSQHETQDSVQSGNLTPRAVDTPRRGVQPQAGPRATGPNPSDQLTAEIERVARSEFPETIAAEKGGLVGAFERVFASPALTAKARVAATLAERERRRYEP